MSAADFLLVFAGVFVAVGAVFVLVGALMLAGPRYRNLDKFMEMVMFGQGLVVIGSAFNVAYRIAIR